MMKTTKELARELGLLRKRTYSTAGCAVGKRGLTDQPFRYLIVIDFESTCWQDTKFKAQEIIEFPAVLLNTMTGQIESVFHYYTQPQEHPILSGFCTELTGIVQGQVDEGIPISLCLRKFTYWLDKLYREKNVVCEGTKTDNPAPVNCTCVTWSDWDLGVCLQYECKRKQLLKPAQLNSWIDLRATYRKFYDRKPNGLNGALQDLGIEFQGREHSGVDDAKNTAMLAYRMITDGCVLKTTKTLKTHERSSSCNAQFRADQNRQTRQVAPQQTDIRAFTGNRQAQKQAKITPQKSAMKAIKQKTPGKQKEMPKKANQTPNKYKRTPNKNQTPEKSKHTPKQFKPTPPNNQSAATTPSKMKTTSDQTNNYLGKPKTPAKGTESLKKTQKRKLITPIKAVSDKSSCSPCRKVARRISPRKLSVNDIYKDPEETCGSNLTRNATSFKTGLQECDMNILVNKNGGPSLSSKPAPQKLPTANASEKTNIKTSFSKQSVSSFKVPLPVGKSPSSRRSVEKNFCTSTPVNGNISQKVLMHGTGPSPIQTHIQSGQKAAHSSSGVSSFRSDKTPLATKPRLNSLSSSSVSLSSFATPSVPSFMKTGSYSSGCRSSGSETTMKITPPLCHCGRRAKRRMVQNPGQNMGRFFFTCSVRHGAASKAGCDYFKWETSLGFGRNSLERNISKQFTPVLGTRSASVSSSGSQKRNLGVRSATSSSQRVFLR